MSEVKALCFDVFGTVVDWRGSIAREVEALGIDGDGQAFADAWRGRYQPAMEEVRAGRRPWVKLDVLHRENLVAVLAERDIALDGTGSRRGPTWSRACNASRPATSWRRSPTAMSR